MNQTQKVKLLLVEFHSLGGGHIGLHACLANQLGLITKKQFGSDIEEIKTLQRNSLKTRSLQMSLALVAIKNFSIN